MIFNLRLVSGTTRCCQSHWAVEWYWMRRFLHVRKLWVKLVAVKMSIASFMMFKQRGFMTHFSLLACLCLSSHCSSSEACWVATVTCCDSGDKPDPKEMVEPSVNERNIREARREQHDFAGIQSSLNDCSLNTISLHRALKFFIMYKHFPSFPSLWGVQPGGFGVPAGGFSSSESTAAANEIKSAERKSARSNDPSATQLEREEDRC